MQTDSLGKIIFIIQIHAYKYWTLSPITLPKDQLRKIIIKEGSVESLFRPLIPVFGDKTSWHKGTTSCPAVWQTIPL